MFTFTRACLVLLQDCQKTDSNSRAVGPVPRSDDLTVVRVPRCIGWTKLMNPQETRATLLPSFNGAGVPDHTNVKASERL